MKRFGMCYAPYYKSLIFVIMASVVTAGLEITFPMIVRHILEVILPARDVVRLGAAAALLLGMYAVCLVLTYFVYSRGRGMGVGIENDLRCRLFRHIESMSFSFFDDVKTGQLLARIISDISEIGDLVFQLPNLIMVCLITMCGSAFFLFYINWKLGALVLFLIAMKTIGTIFLNKRMKKTFIAAREMMGNLSAQAMESLNAIRLIQSFGNEKLEYDKFFAASCRLMKSQRRTFRYEAYLTSSIIFFSNATNLVIIAFGAYFIMKGEMALAAPVRIGRKLLKRRVRQMRMILYGRFPMGMTVLSENGA